MAIKKRIKIVFAVTNDLVTDRRMRRICNSLGGVGYDCLLVGRKFKNSLKFEENYFRHYRMRCLFNKGFLFYFEFNMRLFFFLLRKKADIYCAVDLDTIWPVMTAAKIARKKVVFDAHEYFTELPEIVDRPFIKWVWEKIGNAFVPHTDMAYTISESYSNLLTEKYKIPFQVIRNLPIKRNYVNNNSPKNLLYYQGVLNVGRGLEECIQAVSQVEDLHFLIVGKGDIEDKLKSEIYDLNLSDRVVMHGFVPPDQLGTLAQKARIGILTLSSNSKSYYYSLANKFFDYMHAEIPMICMRFPEYEKFNRQYEVAYLIDELTVENIMIGIEALKDPNVYAILKHNCKLAKEEFHWAKEEVKLIDHYKNLSVELVV